MLVIKKENQEILKISFGSGISFEIVPETVTETIKQTEVSNILSSSVTSTLLDTVKVLHPEYAIGIDLVTKELPELKSVLDNVNPLKGANLYVQLKSLFQKQKEASPVVTPSPSTDNASDKAYVTPRLNYRPNPKYECPEYFPSKEQIWNAPVLLNTNINRGVISWNFKQPVIVNQNRINKIMVLTFDSTGQGVTFSDWGLDNPADARWWRNKELLPTEMTAKNGDFVIVCYIETDQPSANHVTKVHAVSELIEIGCL